MSKAWQGGSTAAWRAVRLLVLERDGWVCQICQQRIPRNAHRDDPQAAQVHHTGDRRLTGDDPAHLQAAHRLCNQRAGEPGRGDPAPTPGGWW